MDGMVTFGQFQPVNYANPSRRKHELPIYPVPNEVMSTGPPPSFLDSPWYQSIDKLNFDMSTLGRSLHALIIENTVKTIINLEEGMEARYRAFQSPSSSSSWTTVDASFLSTWKDQLRASWTAIINKFFKQTPDK